MSKRIAALVLAVTIISLAVAPETQAQRRRDCNRSVSSRYYGSNSNYGVAGQRYYASPYVGSNYGSSYYNGTRYNGQPYYGRVAGTRYYEQDYYRGYRNRNSTRNTVLTIAGPAAVGAGVGAIVGGGKGAGIGALIGGGGGALYYLLRNRGRR
ncbi:MAG TPA: hypothetical protein VFF31_06095 [Blastocatellia bacterium]|nr:hypothetical protein [Blastocatellia bacterium]